jgi:hypothetical protein
MRFVWSRSAEADEPGRWWGAFTFSIPVLYGLILILCSRRIGTADYDQSLVFHELQYWNANLFGLAKQWSPVMCSGLSLAGEPQIPFASLTMLFGYVLGPLTGIVVGTLMYLAIGWIGGYLYSGLWFQHRRQRLLAASLFIGNGFFVCRIAHGHVDFIPFLALPLALWVIHRTCERDNPALNIPIRVVGALLLGALFGVVIDGSPVSIIHWAFWIGIYSTVLSWTRRSLLPLITFASACSVATFLDAGYLWPMLTAQADFPRKTADTFTGPWSLPWFMLIPMRGKVLPANGTGIELSVFIGPFLAFLIWRYRHVLREQLPHEMKMPLLVVSCVSIWLGMGSLHAAGLPAWISPFDWLRPLPGFRSMGVTGRFWGFLALPLSLLAAAALWRFMHNEAPGRRRTLLLSGALLLQVTFQGESVASAWWPSRVHHEASLQGLYDGHPRQIEMMVNPSTVRAPHLQGEYISPVRAITNCYDMDDFTRAPPRSGMSLIDATRVGADSKSSPPSLEAGFVTWNRIRIAAAPQSRDSTVANPGSLLQITLNQAYHSRWTSLECKLTRSAAGNLVANCPADTLSAGSVDLVFFDPVSDLGMHVSIRSARVFLFATIMLALLGLVPKRPRGRQPAVVSVE